MAYGKSVFLLFLVFVAGIIFAGIANLGILATNDMEFCGSCHSMEIPMEEYKQSIHYQNASGVRATCADCHVPEDFFPKMKAKIIAAKDVWHEILGTISTKEDYERYRWDMASRVWEKMKSTDSRECRSCHAFDQMDLSAQSRSGRNRHGRAIDEEKTCIDCHKGIAHEEPLEPDEEYTQ